RDEGDCLQRNLVEPLRIVDDAKQGLFVGGGRDQAEYGQSDEKSIRGRSGAATEGNVQRFVLGPRQFIQVVQQGCAQVLEAGEGELHVGLDASHLDTAEA